MLTGIVLISHGGPNRFSLTQVQSPTGSKRQLSWCSTLNPHREFLCSDPWL